MADLYDFLPPFEIFIEKYKVGDKVIGQVKRVGKSNEKVFGLFVTIDKNDCLLPISFMPKLFKEQIESLRPETKIPVIIDKIDIEKKK